MQKLTLKDLTNGKEYNCKSINNSNHVYENRTAIIEKIKKEAKEKNIDIEVTESKIIAKNTNNFVMLPTPNQMRLRQGHIKFRSKDYIFTFTNALGEIKQSFGDKPKASELLNNGFYLIAYNGDKIEFELSEIVN